MASCERFCLVLCLMPRNAAHPPGSCGPTTRAVLIGTNIIFQNLYPQPGVRRRPRRRKELSPPGTFPAWIGFTFDRFNRDVALCAPSQRSWLSDLNVRSGSAEHDCRLHLLSRFRFLSDQQDWTRALLNHFVGHTSERPTPHPTLTVRGHHD